MEGRIIFDYFYGQESEMHAFYRVPKLLFTSSHFKSLSSDAKILYGLMLDRMALSQKNKWLDAENRAYIIYSQQEAMEMLNCKVNKAINLFKELEEIGLLERKKQGQGKPYLLYLKDFVQEHSEKEQTLEKSKSGIDDKNPDLEKTKVKTFEKPSSRPLKNQSLDLGKTNHNYNNINNTKGVITTNLISSMKNDVNDEYQAYSEIVKENLSLDAMLERYPQDADIIEGIYELIVETVIAREETTWISKREYPTNLVKSKFLKLNNMHLEYILECLRGNTTKVRNMKNYMLSALFNASSTMGSYYQSAVNYDMSKGAV